MKSLSHHTATEPLLPFEIATIEQWNEQNSDQTNALSCGSSQYKIIWITQGAGIYKNDMIDVSIRPQHVFCLSSPRQKIYIENNAKGYIVSFTENFLNIGELEFDLICQSNLLCLFSKTCGVFLCDELAADLNEILVRMIKECQNIFVFKTEILKRYLKIFLIYLTRQIEGNFQPVMQTRNMELVQRYMGALEKNYRDKKMVAHYANMLFVTPNYLNEIVKKITGYAASYHIRQRVALEAKRMALYSNNNMKEIAYDLGFLDCAHFSKFFKTTTGTNFTEFKKERLTIATA